MALALHHHRHHHIHQDQLGFLDTDARQRFLAELLGPGRVQCRRRAQHGGVFAEATDQHQTDRQAIDGRVGEGLGGVRVVRSFRREKLEELASPGQVLLADETRRPG